MPSYRVGERARAIEEEEEAAAVAEGGKDGGVGQARERVKGPKESLLGPTSKERGQLAIGASDSTETCIKCSVKSPSHQSPPRPRTPNTEKIRERAREGERERESLKRTNSI
jgi:hypothetical protein